MISTTIQPPIVVDLEEDAMTLIRYSQVRIRNQRVQGLVKDDEPVQIDLCGTAIDVKAQPSDNERNVPLDGLTVGTPEWGCRYGEGRLWLSGDIEMLRRFLVQVTSRDV